MTDVPASTGVPRGSRRLTVVFGLSLVALLAPYGLLATLTLGSGWSYPHLLPDRIDLAPWRHLAADRDGLRRAALTSLALSLAVSLPSTIGGLVAGRAIRRRASGRWLFAAYFPFVVSPMVVGPSLYDLMVRLRLAGTAAGVIVCQGLFAFAFATVLFCELWSPRLERARQLVATLGGGRWATIRHVLVPQAAGLIGVCLIQTALSSWLDYGLVSLIGGGSVPTLTTMLFAYIREASVNQAALSGLTLLVPTVAGYLLTGLILFRRQRRMSQPE